MSLYVQAVVNGILVGGVYSLMAVGLSLIFGVMRVINFAHGDMMVWGMYLSFWLFTTLGVDPYLSILATGAAIFLLGAAVQRGLVNRILDAPHEMQILLMMGVALVLENVALMAWGPDPRRVNVSYGLSTFWVGPIVFDLPRLVTFGVALALALALYLFLKKTDLGRMIRAAADNRIGALRSALGVLNDRERRIFEARRLADDPMTLEALSDEFDISRERVRQIEVRAFEKVQSAVKAGVARIEMQARLPQIASPAAPV